MTNKGEYEKLEAEVADMCPLELNLLVLELFGYRVCAVHEYDNAPMVLVLASPECSIKWTLHEFTEDVLNSGTYDDDAFGGDNEPSDDLLRRVAETTLTTALAAEFYSHGVCDDYGDLVEEFPIELTRDVLSALIRGLDRNTRYHIKDALLGKLMSMYGHEDANIFTLHAALAPMRIVLEACALGLLYTRAGGQASENPDKPT